MQTLPAAEVGVEGDMRERLEFQVEKIIENLDTGCFFPKKHVVRTWFTHDIRADDTTMFL